MCPQQNCLVLFRQHRATEVQKLCFLSVDVLTGVARWILGQHDILPCVLIQFFSSSILIS